MEPRRDDKRIPITRNLTIPTDLRRSVRDIEYGAQHHPQRHRYVAAIILRARAHHTQTPYAIIGGWAALAYKGLATWVNDAHITLHVASNFQQAHNVLDATRRRIRPNTETWAPDRNHPHLRVTAPEIALVDCLIDLQRNRHSWHVTPVPGLAPWEVRAIQLIDAVRRICPLSFPWIRNIARNIFSARSLKKLLKLSSSQADSPPETTLRLIAEQIRENLEVQITIHDPHNRRIITTADAGWPDIKVALFYDGQHHLDRTQRDKDTEISINLNRLGWETLRITHGLLAKPHNLAAAIRHTIHRATTAP
ncbi:MAG: hypothetical protein Q4A92_08875 [Corynebacterium sp.]|nr:hypothetical protein [Corynebacterium sp.]